MNIEVGKGKTLCFGIRFCATFSSGNKIVTDNTFGREFGFMCQKLPTYAHLGTNCVSGKAAKLFRLGPTGHGVGTKGALKAITAVWAVIRCEYKPFLCNRNMLFGVYAGVTRCMTCMSRIFVCVHLIREAYTWFKLPILQLAGTRPSGTLLGWFVVIQQMNNSNTNLVEVNVQNLRLMMFFKMWRASIRWHCGCGPFVP